MIFFFLSTYYINENDGQRGREKERDGDRESKSMRKKKKKRKMLKERIDAGMTLFYVIPFNKI